MTTPRFEVTCIIPDGPDHDRRIDSIGGFGASGWTMLEDEAIRRLRNNELTLWTKGGGKVAEVIAWERSPGRWHLQTVADGIRANNLLYLPRCPASYQRVT